MKEPFREREDRQGVPYGPVKKRVEKNGESGHRTVGSRLEGNGWMNDKTLEF